MAPLRGVGDNEPPTPFTPQTPPSPPSPPQTSSNTTSGTYPDNSLATAIGVVVGVIVLTGILLCFFRARQAASTRTQLQPYRGKTAQIAATNATADHWLTPNPKPTRAKPQSYALTVYSGTSPDVSGVAEPPPAYSAGDNGGGAPSVSATSGGT